MLLSRLLLICMLCFGAASASVPSAFAQATEGTPAPSYDPAKLDAAQKEVSAADTQLQDFRGKEDVALNDDLELLELQQRLEEIAASMATIYDDLQPRLENIKARETELGEPPAEGQPEEPQKLKDERAQLAADRAEVNAEIGEVNAVAEKASALAEEVHGVRRSLFRQRLLGRSDVTAENLRALGHAVNAETAELYRRVSSWLSFTWAHERRPFLWALSLTLLLGLLFVYGEYRLFSRYVVHDRKNPDPSAFSKYTYAFWSTLLPTLGLAIFATLAIFFLRSFNVLRGDISELLNAFFQFIWLVFFVSRLAGAVLAPRAPTWRLVNVSDSGAHKLWWLIAAIAVVNGIVYTSGIVSEVLESPVIVTIGRSLIAAIVIGVLLVILSRIRPMRTDDGGHGAWPRSISIPLLVLGIILIVLPIMGYIGLARFISIQVIVLGSLFVAMYLGFLAANAVSEPEDFRASALGEMLLKRFGIGEIAVEQIGLLCGLLIYLLVLALGVPIIFLVWGYHIRDIQVWIASTFSQVTVGSVSISLSGILVGLVVFGIGYFFSRWFQRWLDDKIMRRSRMDVGLRNSVRTGIGYVGIIIAAIIGLSVAGLNLSNVAIVAGALSVGIGFGLQNIVNNFVSGLILLVERPFKVGDWVETGTTQGFVRHISVRATEIETFQRQSVIVPNSEFINTPVSNWTHRNSLGRCEVAVGVAYDSDPRQVMAILEEIGKSNDLVMADPPPFVAFIGFGASSLDFELRVFLRDILYTMVVATDLRTRIFERFREEGIEIPFPQTDVHLKMPASEENLAVEARKAELQAKAAEEEEASEPDHSPKRQGPN